MKGNPTPLDAGSMKPLQHVLINRVHYLKNHTFNNIGFLFLFFFLLMVSCENDVNEVNEFAGRKDYPTEISKNIEVIRTDSGHIVLRVHSEELQRFSLADEPYIVFPKGIRVTGYIMGQYPDTAYSMSADYAVNYENKSLWEARYNVVAVNRDGEQLNTELLFWDEKNEKIWSDKFSRITTTDGVLFGENGFEARQDFTKWKLININNSVVNVRDE